MRFIRYTAIALIAVVIVTGFSAWIALRSSLPQLEGGITAEGLSAPAAIERDEEGAPTIRARSRQDLAFATGFAHAQDRYFQMDLMRRAAAGELAGLLGASLLETDKKY